MGKFLIKDSDRLCRSQKYVGTKAKNLALLLEMRKPVPHFFVVTTKTFYHFFKDYNKTNENFSDFNEAKRFLSSIEFGSNKIFSLFWKIFENQFLALQSQNSGTKVSVRSSSPFEDQATQSFAGQFETYLDVENLNEVWDAVKKCWLSMWQSNVLSYLQHTNLKPKYKAMAVIIQKMVHPGVSGVLFSREPVSNDNSKMLIEFSTGATDDVVSGKVEPHRIQVNKATGDPSWIFQDRDTEKGKKQFEKIKALLPEEKILELFTIGKNLENQFGYPVDIEWAVEKEKLWLLQVRPLTTNFANERQRSDEDGNLWTDYFFVERFVDPVTPLGWSIIGRWIKKRAVCEPLHFLGFDELTRNKRITRLFDSYPFTRVEVFQSMYSVIPDFALSEDKKRAFLNADSHRLWLKVLILRLPFIFSRLLLRDINWFPPLHLRAWQRFLTRYLNQFKNNQTTLDSVDLTILGRWFLKVELLTDEFLSYHRWSITFADLFFHLLEKLLPLLLPDLKSLNCVDLICGLPGNKTVEANIDLAQLAKSLNIDLTKNKKFDVRQLNDIPGFQNLFELFLKKHGHRSQNLDPYYPTWRDNPVFLKRTIVDMVTQPKIATIIEESQSRIKRNRLNAGELLFESLSKEKKVIRLVKKSIIELILRMTQSFALLRENQRYYWHFALAEKRRIILEVGRRMVKQKMLTLPEHIFFLRRNEFLKCFEIDVDVFFLRQKAEKRLEKWEKRQALFKTKHVEKKTSENKSLELRGLGVSAGIIQARARVVSSLDEAQEMKQGAILVTGSVDPAWTPIFAKAAGLVLEVGGILSHASIVAREFRLPAVTSVSGATVKIKDNQLIEIDGLKGTVTII